MGNRGRTGSITSLARIAAVVALCASIGACQTKGEDHLTTSTDRTQLSTAAADAIAADMANKFAEVVGPGTGTVVLKTDSSSFGNALASSLKAWGYAVAAPDQKADGSNLIQLAYAIDTFEDGVLAHLSAPTISLGRAYALTSVGAAPSSPLSITRRS